jgi:hypothetical protein
MKTTLRSCLAIVASAGLASLVHAQPVLVYNALSEDMSADGTKTVGYLFDNGTEEYVLYSWERGVGYTQLPGTNFPGEPLRASADFGAFATSIANTSDFGNLNCFDGYCTTFSSNCVLGTLLPPPNPCMIPSIAHRYTPAGGWINMGSIPRVLDGATGRFFGGTRCGSSVNSVNDISGNGRFVVGGAWTTGLLNSSGDPSFGLCTNFVAYVADSTTGIVTPLEPTTSDSNADSVSNDGSVITGYAQGEIIDPIGNFEGRQIVVWLNGAKTVLDNRTNSFTPYIVTPNGNAIAGGPGNAFSQNAFAIDDVLLVRWNRQSDNSWIPQNLGRPVDFFDGVELQPLSRLSVLATSADGSTIVGTARYGLGFFGAITRPFIWRADINGGVPIDLPGYIQQIAPGSTVGSDAARIIRINAMSADGNAISVQVQNAFNTCTPPAQSLDAFSHAVLYLNGAGIACDAPRIAFPLRDFVSTQYTPFGAVVNVFASGTGPLTYTWQREVPANSGTWVNLTEACAGFGFGTEWDYEGVNKNQLRVGQANCGNNRDGRYRVIVSNACGSVTSSPATVSFTQGTLINQQPTSATGCPTSFSSFFAVAVSNSADLSEQWEIAPASSPQDFVVLSDGEITLPDGRPANVFGSTGQFLGITPGAFANESNYVLRCTFISPCGNATSETVTFSVGGASCPAICDSIDFNNDGLFPDTLDIDDFLAVFAGGPCSNDPNCGDIDFNNDGLFPDTLDIDSFVSVFAGGPCI